jgi:hypothetical protein
MSEIVFHPSWVTRLRDRGRINVIPKTTTTEVNMKQVAPMIVIVGSKIQGDWYEQRDISDGIGKRNLGNWGKLGWGFRVWGIGRGLDRRRRRGAKDGAGGVSLGCGEDRTDGRRQWLWWRRHARCGKPRLLIP